MRNHSVLMQSGKRKTKFFFVSLFMHKEEIEMQEL